MEDNLFKEFQNVFEKIDQQIEFPTEEEMEAARRKRQRGRLSKHSQTFNKLAQHGAEWVKEEDSAIKKDLLQNYMLLYSVKYLKKIVVSRISIIDRPIMPYTIFPPELIDIEVNRIATNRNLQKLFIDECSASRKRKKKTLTFEEAKEDFIAMAKLAIFDEIQTGWKYLISLFNKDPEDCISKHHSHSKELLPLVRRLVQILEPDGEQTEEGSVGNIGKRIPKPTEAKLMMDMECFANEPMSKRESTQKTKKLKLGKLSDDDEPMLSNPVGDYMDNDGDSDEEPMLENVSSSPQLHNPLKKTTEVVTVETARLVARDLSKLEEMMAGLSKVSPAERASLIALSSIALRRMVTFKWMPAVCNSDSSQDLNGTLFARIFNNKDIRLEVLTILLQRLGSVEQFTSHQLVNHWKVMICGTFYENDCSNTGYSRDLCDFFLGRPTEKNPKKYIESLSVDQAAPAILLKQAAQLGFSRVSKWESTRHPFQKKSPPQSSTPHQWNGWAKHGEPVTIESVLERCLLWMIFPPKEPIATKENINKMNAQQGWLRMMQQMKSQLLDNDWEYDFDFQPQKNIRVGDVPLPETCFP